MRHFSDTTESPSNVYVYANVGAGNCLMFKFVFFFANLNVKKCYEMLSNC